MAKGPYSGYIIAKGSDGKPADGRIKENRRSYKQFYSDVDKGSNKPAFCYQGRKESLEEEIRSMERAVEMGSVSGDRKLQHQSSLVKKQKRLDAINEGHEGALKKLDEDRDAWAARFKEIGEEIKNAMPTRKAVKDRRVNPHTVLKNEKSGLGELKKEYQVLGKLLGEETNISYLQRD